MIVVASVRAVGTRTAPEISNGESAGEDQKKGLLHVDQCDLSRDRHAAFHILLSDGPKTSSAVPFRAGVGRAFGPYAHESPKMRLTATKRRARMAHLGWLDHESEVFCCLADALVERKQFDIGNRRPCGQRRG